MIPSPSKLIVLVMTFLVLLCAWPRSAVSAAYIVTDLGRIPTTTDDMGVYNRITIDDNGNISHVGQLSAGSYSITHVSNPAQDPGLALGTMLTGPNGTSVLVPTPTFPGETLGLGVYAIDGQGVNQLGMVVGAAGYGQGGSAFVYRPGTGNSGTASFLPMPQHLFNPNNIPFLDQAYVNSSVAYGINNTGTVVGTMYAGDYHHAFISNGMITQDLNNLIDTNSSLLLTSATSINNSGIISGYATDSQGNYHEVILTPTATPEPSSITIVLTMTTLYVFMKRNRLHARLT